MSQATLTPCPHGCASGACLPDPCASTNCANDPLIRCKDANTLEIDAPAGCEGGQCLRDVTAEPCSFGCADGACLPDPCGGVVCDAPPADVCVDVATLNKYDPVGTCQSGSCSYGQATVPCLYGCEAGACKPNPCSGQTCDVAPPGECIDANRLKTYVAPGSCVAGQCGFGWGLTTCEFGCSAGSCNQDPCQGIACTTPPTASCSDATTLLSYAATGTCTNGQCKYPSSSTTCEHGCEAGACKADPCAGVSCDAPPSTACMDAQTLYTYPTVGACAEGTCSYEPTITVCQFGCNAGACLPDPCKNVSCYNPIHICQKTTGRCVEGSCVYDPVPGCVYTEITPDQSLSGSSMGLDDGDRPHVAYYDVSARTVRYATWADDTSAWSIQDVYTHTGYKEPAGQTAFVFTPTGQPHVSFYTVEYGYTPSGVRQDVRGWVSRAIEDANGWTYDIGHLSVSPHPSGAFYGRHGFGYGYTSSNVLRFGYTKVTSGIPDRCSTYSSYGFGDEPTLSPYYTGLGLSFALDAADNIHMVYLDRGLRQVSYAYVTPSSSVIEAIETNVDRMPDSALVVDATGVPHVAYGRGISPGALVYAKRLASGWSTTVVDSQAHSASSGYGLYTSIDLDGTGNPHIAYAVGSSRIKYAYFNGTTWTRKTADRYGDVGAYPTIKLDSSDRVHMSFIGQTRRAVIYVRLP